ncbi:MAG: hypothetical protein AABX37_04025, partial [Nanoarchaeota archaeon]
TATGAAALLANPSLPGLMIDRTIQQREAAAFVQTWEDQFYPQAVHEVVKESGLTLKRIMLGNENLIKIEGREYRSINEYFKKKPGFYISGLPVKETLDALLEQTRITPKDTEREITPKEAKALDRLRDLLLFQQFDRTAYYASVNQLDFLTQKQKADLEMLIRAAQTVYEKDWFTNTRQQDVTMGKIENLLQEANSVATMMRIPIDANYHAQYFAQTNYYVALLSQVVLPKLGLKLQNAPLLPLFTATELEHALAKTAGVIPLQLPISVASEGQPHAPTIDVNKTRMPKYDSLYDNLERFFPNTDPETLEKIVLAVSNEFEKLEKVTETTYTGVVFRFDVDGQTIYGKVSKEKEMLVKEARYHQDAWNYLFMRVITPKLVGLVEIGTMAGLFTFGTENLGIVPERDLETYFETKRAL